MTAGWTRFPDPAAGVEPLLAVADLDRALGFWVGQVGAETVTQWETYALLRLGKGQLHLAMTGDPPPDRAVRLVPPDQPDDEAVGEVVIRVGDCRAVVDALAQRDVRFLGRQRLPRGAAKYARSPGTRTATSWRSLVRGSGPDPSARASGGGSAHPTGTPASSTAGRSSNSLATLPLSYTTVTSKGGY